MREFTVHGEDELPTRREFGRRLTAATVLPAALSLFHGVETPAAHRRRSEYVPEDTYPFFTESEPAPNPEHVRIHVEPDDQADGAGR